MLVSNAVEYKFWESYILTQPGHKMYHVSYRVWLMDHLPAHLYLNLQSVILMMTTFKYRSARNNATLTQYIMIIELLVMKLITSLFQDKNQVYH